MLVALVAAPLVAPIVKPAVGPAVAVLVTLLPALFAVLAAPEYSGGRGGNFFTIFIKNYMLLCRVVASFPPGNHRVLSAGESSRTGVRFH